MTASLLMLLLAIQSTPVEQRLSVTGVGRFAVFADLDSIAPDGDGVKMRALEINETPMLIGDTAYDGGWSWWRFDCAARTADRLDFASLRSDGTEGPITPQNAPPYPISPGGDADELAAVACATERPPVEATSTADAVKLGQELLRGDIDSPR